MPRLAVGFGLLLAAACVDLSRPPLPDVDLGPPGDAAGDRPTGGVVDAARDIPDAAPLDTPPGDAADAPLDPDVSPEVAPADGSLDLPLVTNGNPCSQASQCASGFCASGVCCDSACGGLCQACNVAGKLGSCSPVPAGEDPGDACPRDPPSTCAFDGTCNGNGSCRRYPAMTECAPGSCSGATEQAASTCNGSGTCVAGATRSCSPNVCMGPSCGASCTGDGQCQTGFFCEASRCVVKRTQGAACTEASQCSTGFCVDQVCCASQCGQSCFACNVAGQLGTCTAVPNGQDPRAQCPMQPESTCGRLGGCNGSGACRLHPMGTVCLSGSCGGSTENAPGTCNGLGACVPGAAKDCGLYVCGMSSCNTSCAGSGQCSAGVACTSNACTVLAGLALHWRFEEAAGATATDSSGNSFHGMYTGISGAPASSTAVPPLRYTNTRSRDFVLANRHAVRLPGFPAALKPTTNLTLSVWYRATAPALDADGSELISGGNAYNVRLGPTQVEVSKDTGVNEFRDCRATVAGYLDGAWHHVAAVFTPTGITIYFDGTARAATGVGCTSAVTISYAAAGADLLVGRHGEGQDIYDFGGSLDEVRIYTRALSAAEIAHLAGGGS